MKKILSLVLALALLLGLAAMPAVANAEGEMVTLIYYNAANEGQADDIANGLVPVNQLLAEHGIQLDMRLLLGSEYVDKMNLIVNSNEYYDLAFTSNWRFNFYDNIGKGAFLDITDLIGQHAPDIIEQFPDEYLDFGKVGGKLYGILNIQILANPQGVRMNTEYLEKYNVDPASLATLEGLYAYFDIIKENEPGIWPIAGPMSGGQLGIYSTDINAYATIEEGDDTLTVIPKYETKFYAESNRVNREMYDKGYIRPDIAAITDNVSEIMAGMYAGDFGDVKPGAAAELESRWGWPVTPVKMADAMMPYNSGTATMHALSINTKHADKALEYLNLVNTNSDVINALLYGQEGVHHIITDEGKVAIAPGSKYFLGNISWEFGNVFNSAIMDGKDENVWKETEEINAAATRSPIIGFALDTAPIQNEIAQLDAIEKEYTNWLYMDNHEELEQQRIEKMKAAGIEKMIAEVQRQVDEWAVANGKK